MKRIIFILTIFISLCAKAEYNNINLYKKVTDLFYQKKYKEALLSAQKYLKKVDDNPNIGDLAALYLRIYENHPIKGIKPVKFLLETARNKRDYISKERIILAVADFLFKHKEYKYALRFYNWLEKNHNSKSLVYDDALWNSFLIHKKLKDYPNALLYLNKIISTHSYSIYVGTYNQYHIYDAYIEKADLLLKIKKEKKAVKTLKEFIKNFSMNDRVDDAYFKLCNIESKIYCCELIKKYKYSQYYHKAENICDERNN